MATETTLDKRPEDALVNTERTRNRPTFRPNVDIVETAEELTVLVDMPGIRADDVDIHFENGTLAINGKVQDRQAEGTNYLSREYDVGDFYRSFQVSETIDPNGITAEYKDGVLTLHLAKAEAAKPKKIAVKTQ